MTWFHNGEKLTAKSRFKPNYDLYTGVASLKIDDVNLEDAGNYTIIAVNLVGKDESQADALVKHIAVLDETPNINPEEYRRKMSEDSPNELQNDFRAPKFIIPLDNLKINEGDDINFLCKVDGFPKPKVFFI